MQKKSSRIPYRRKGLRGKGFLHPNPVFAAERLSENFIDRFWRFVEKTDFCWLWKGTLNAKGYGCMCRGTKSDIPIKAHRVSWLIHRGAIPDGLCVLHNCPAGDNPACVNPEHLWLGTILENNADQERKGRRSPPPRFHGEDHPMAKLSQAQAERLRELYATTEARTGELAGRFSVTPTTAHGILTGRIWVGLSAHLQPSIDRKLAEHPVPCMRGENHPQVKLTLQKVEAIRKLYSSGAANQRMLGERFGIGQSTVSRIVLHKNW